MSKPSAKPKSPAKAGLKQIKTSTGRFIEMPSAAEDAAITRAAKSDPDAAPLTDQEWARVKPLVKRGRPAAEVVKERITIRLSPDVVMQFRRTGPGWQTRMDEALKDWLKGHKLRGRQR